MPPGAAPMPAPVDASTTGASAGSAIPGGGAPADQPGAPAPGAPVSGDPGNPGDRLVVTGPAGPGARRRTREGARPGWLAVGAVALVLGLAGGFLGALGHDALTDDSAAAGFSGGLTEADLVELPPLKEPGSVAAVAQAVLPSTVQVLAEYDGQASGATGSGWVMDGDGHVVTNNHVIASAAKGGGPIVVVDNERNRYEAKVVGRSAVYDLAILEVEDSDGLVPAKLGHSKKLRVGEPVVAIGSPLSLPSTVTSGIVSYLQRPVTTGASADESSYINAVQTDAAINPGNSGGPLLNMQGEVIGVNSAIATAGGGSIDSEAGNIGVGFAIPVEQVRVTADQILKTGKAQYPVIGAKVKTGGVPTGDGAELDEIISGSPAEEAGLRKGDLITRVNGARVTEGIALIVAIRAYQPGQTIEFTIERGGNEREVEVTLDGEDDPAS
ncbi:trypsin-like peptidase domain-containing protein [Nocardioides sp. zg-536]|uniref:Trypsin-like peptidase domain-containing protein n=2 Tax=Nocardioides faecalis TaxID=2803858 RepID=A0A938YCT0_9ACTN|nr:trypsin-like peptidase domain-containing protein [Nocardioides faecalis]QVI60650.1 trypsin-like peptidase domain-containing protein [Nocardioides faecalis]